MPGDHDTDSGHRVLSDVHDIDHPESMAMESDSAVPSTRDAPRQGLQRSETVEMRWVRRKVAGEVWRKAGAILVALLWTSFIKSVYILPGFRLLIALLFYVFLWPLTYLVVTRVPVVTFEFYTLTVAELSAFLFRDASWALRNAIWPHGLKLKPAGLKPDDMHERGAELVLGIAWRRLLGNGSDAAGPAGGEEPAYFDGEVFLWGLLWALLMLVVGGLLMVGLRVLRSLAQQRSEEQFPFDEFKECLKDVEIDTAGLVLAWSMLTLLYRLCLGPEWEELLEEAVDARAVAVSWIVGLGTPALMALVLFALVSSGAMDEGIRFRYIQATLSFAAGFALNVAFKNKFLTSFWGASGYPFFMLLVGARIVANLRRERGPERGQGGCCLSSLMRRGCRLPGVKLAYIAAFQVCMALAFEGDIDLFIKTSMQNQDFAGRLSSAAIVSAGWVALSCRQGRLAEAAGVEGGPPQDLAA